MSEHLLDLNVGSIETHDLLLYGARRGIDIQREDGSFEPGRNGTYDEPETPVSVTSQWLRTLTKAYDITGETEFSDAANNAIDYLLSKEARPYGHTFYCRKVESKTKCNGLAGQAEVIRGLAYASEILDRDDAKNTAEELFLLHPFDNELGMWRIVEIDGRNLFFDRTLNHQILFAASGSKLINKSNKIEKRLFNFLNKLEVIMDTHENGLIRHYVRPPFLTTIRTAFRSKSHYRLLPNEFTHYYYMLSGNLEKKERGYQTVNLEALSRLKMEERLSHHKFWNSKKLNQILEYLHKNKEYISKKINTEHGSSLQGIGISKIEHRFLNVPINQNISFIKNDLDFSTDNDSGIILFNIDGLDPNSKAVLLVNLVGLPNVLIKKDLD